jgi:hypothetical protein
MNASISWFLVIIFRKKSMRILTYSLFFSPHSPPLTSFARFSVKRPLTSTLPLPLFTHFPLDKLLGSSVVEQVAVNHLVASSNLARAAILRS